MSTPSLKTPTPSHSDIPAPTSQASESDGKSYRGQGEEKVSTSRGPLEIHVVNGPSSVYIKGDASAILINSFKSGNVTYHGQYSPPSKHGKTRDPPPPPFRSSCSPFSAVESRTSQGQSDRGTTLLIPVGKALWLLYTVFVNAGFLYYLLHIARGWRTWRDLDAADWFTVFWTLFYLFWTVGFWKIVIDGNVRRG